MPSKHPRYPRDTILEALCEFRLKPSARTEWSPRLPATILQKLGAKNFPGMEPVKELGIEMSVDKDTRRTTQRVVEGPPKIRYSSDDGTKLVQVGPNLFCYNTVKKYPGWPEMKRHIKGHWSKLSSVLQPESIERIGLRYINRMPLTPERGSIADWLKPTKFLPQAVIEAMPRSNARIDVQVSERDQVIVMLSVQPEAERSGIKNVILDIDRITYLQKLPSIAELMDSIENMHLDVWNIFDEARTEFMVEYMNQKGDYHVL
jgi:uncharacterized protein (TIGR04255 family)